MPQSESRDAAVLISVAERRRLQIGRRSDVLPKPSHGDASQSQLIRVRNALKILVRDRSVVV